MGAYVLIGGLWAAVLVYWLWSRRPTTADTVGLFRRELRVLRTATPQRVAAANRLDATRPVPGARVALAELHPGDALAAAALSHRRNEMRRRRRDILCVLAGAAAFTLLIAVLTGSLLLVALNVACDLAFGGYVALLFRTVAAQVVVPAARRRYDAPVRQAEAASQAAALEPMQMAVGQTTTGRYDDTDYFASAVLTGVERPPLAARIARRTAASRTVGSRTAGPRVATAPTGPAPAGPAPAGADRAGADRAATAAPASTARPAPPAGPLPASSPRTEARPVGRHSANVRPEVDYDLTEHEQVELRHGAGAYAASGAYGDFDDYEALALAN